MQQPISAARSHSFGTVAARTLPIWLLATLLCLLPITIALAQDAADADRAAAIPLVAAHYESLFGDDPATMDLRDAYAMKNGTVPDAANRQALSAFFWWTAWAAVTERPGSTITYTNNWPNEPRRPRAIDHATCGPVRT
mgnify:CR=1 FL=1